MNHIQTFSELNSEKVKFLLSEKFPYRDVLSLVKEVNTRIIYENVPAEQSLILIKSFKYKAFGYKGKNDFKLTTTAGDKPEFKNISVTPACHYSLHDNFAIEPAPDMRSKIIVGLLADEFERIKCRALYTFETYTVSEQIKVYALKNRQFIKTCFHNHKAGFHDLFTLNPNYLHYPVPYIHFYINFFLIKLRLFYEKLFVDFLGPGKKNEKQLLAELFQMNPALLHKKCYNEPTPKPINEENCISEQISHSFDPSNTLTSAYELIAKEHNIKSAQLKQILDLAGKVKWNGNRNILGDVIYQFMQRKDAKGQPLLDASPDVIASLISLLAIDSTNAPLSKATMKTYLLPSKNEKRPKGGTKGKIDII